LRRFFVLIIILVVFLGLVSVGQRYLPGFANLVVDKSRVALPESNKNVKVVTEESVTIDIVKKAGPSVVTVVEGVEPQSIGSGFIISDDGMLVTSKHVVSDTAGKYQVITSDDKKYNVQKIYRDPLNDIALLKIDPKENSGVKLKVIDLADSSKLRVGQYAIAIGTALGEFRNTVTTGVISGLGRGITAGSIYEGSVERLDNVIQTSAAINPGNSGGPLLNSSGQVIGVNTAVSESGQNIGFAIPINSIKDSFKNFNETGQFNRPYLGVAYKMVSRDIAILNDLPEGAYIQDVAVDSPAEKAGIERGDILIKVDGKKINGHDQLSSFISKKKVGDNITLTIYREGKIVDVRVVLMLAPGQ
jgi:S1-C subfamily serine protease